MRRSAITAAIVVAVGVGCSGAPTPQPSASTTIPAPIQTTPAPQILPEVVLTADLDEPAARWRLAGTFPIGDGADQLGYKPSHETPTIEPTAFTVAADGSIWIIDAAKQRVVHYSRDGSFVADFHALLGSSSRDLVFVGQHLLVDGLYYRGLVYEVDEQGNLVARHRVTEDGSKTVYLTDFIPTPNGLYAEIGGYTNPVATGPIGIYGLNLPGNGQIREGPGLPLRSGTWFWLTSSRDGSFEFHFLDGVAERVQPVRINVVASKEFGKRHLEGPVGAGNFVVDGNDVYMYVMMSVTTPHGGGDQIGGRFLLRVGQSPLLFERLPESTLIDDTQRRHIALGTDGHLYLMQIDTDAVRIYRRP